MLEQCLQAGGRFSRFLWLCSWVLLRPGNKGKPLSQSVSLADKTREHREATTLIPSLLAVTRTEALWYHAGMERRGGRPSLDLLHCPFFPSNPWQPPPTPRRPVPDPAGELPCITVAPTAQICSLGAGLRPHHKAGPEDWECGSAGLRTQVECQKTLPSSACSFASQLHTNKRLTQTYLLSVQESPAEVWVSLLQGRGSECGSACMGPFERGCHYLLLTLPLKSPLTTGNGSVVLGCQLWVILVSLEHALGMPMSTPHLTQITQQTPQLSSKGNLWPRKIIFSPYSPIRAQVTCRLIF